MIISCRSTIMGRYAIYCTPITHGDSERIDTTIIDFDQLQRHISQMFVSLADNYYHYIRSSETMLSHFARQRFENKTRLNLASRNAFTSFRSFHFLLDYSPLHTSLFESREY